MHRLEGSMKQTRGGKKSFENGRMRFRKKERKNLTMNERRCLRDNGTDVRNVL